MFGWFRRSQPAFPVNAPMFDPSADLDVEAVFGAPPASTARASPKAADAFQEVSDIDPEDRAIIVQAAHQAQAEILAIMRETGVAWSEKEQHDKMFARALEIRQSLMMFKDMVSQVRDSHEEARRDYADMANKVVSMRQRTSLDQLGDFWREHPFLVGFFGADVVHKLKKQLGQH